MSYSTGIEWTDWKWNPVIGCTKRTREGSAMDALDVLTRTLFHAALYCAVTLAVESACYLDLSTDRFGLCFASFSGPREKYLPVCGLLDDAMLGMRVIKNREGTR
jgi:hypothetical protein